MTESEGRIISNHLASFRRTLTAWQGFAQSFLALLDECEHNEPLMAHTMRYARAEEPRSSVVSALDANLVAYVAGLGAVIDQTRTLMRRHGDKQVMQEFEERKMSLAQEVPSAPFIAKLRTYVLHYLSVPWAFSLHVNVDDGRQVSTFEVQLDRDQLLEMKEWGSAARSFLEKQKPRFHITPLILAFTEAEVQVATWSHNSIMQLRTPEMDATDELIRRYNLAMTNGAHDGSDWDEFMEHVAENIRRDEAGEPQIDWRDVKDVR